MSSKGDSMKKSQISSPILIALLFLSGNIIFCPKITAPPPPIPDQFIADIFPKINNTNVHLLNASANITLNATDLSNKIGVTFNGTYTLFNPQNPTNLTIILPFSLCLDVVYATFGVSVNDSQVPFELVSFTEENLTSMEENIDIIPAFAVHCPISLITFNLTLLENNTYIVKYQFESSIVHTLNFPNSFYMVYSSDTAKLWKGNATEKVEFKTFGGNPHFGIVGNCEVLRQLLDIEGGKRFICEWNNTQNSTVQIEIIFYGSTNGILPGTIEIIVLNILAYIAITIVTVVWIIRRKKKRF